MNGPVLLVQNTNGGANDTAVDLRVQQGEAPMTVDSGKTVTNLSADKVDGQDSSALAMPRGYAFVEIEGDIDPARSKGVNDVLIPTGPTNTTLYCVDLTFTPHVGVGSPFLLNSAVVATVTAPNNVLSNSCPTPHQDAAARTYASGNGSAAPINFEIVFV